MAGSFMAAAVTPTLSVTPSNRNVPASAGATTFTVTSNSTWTAGSSAAWCTVNGSGSGNGVITANVTSNETNTVRIATITISVSGLASQTVTVTQAASTVGSDEHLLVDLQVYPNPTRGIFRLKAGKMKDQDIEVSVLDISGKKILSRNCSGAEEYSFDISQEPKGYYFIRISSEKSSEIRRIALVD
jgi:hypothetical protein